MSLDSFYLEKYLKYKAKYLELKNIIGGGKGACNDCDWDDEKVKCTAFKPRSKAKADKKYCVCGHADEKHQDESNKKK